jgi:hypothetical protein
MTYHAGTDEAIYRDIGRVVVHFQLLENELREIGWFCTAAGHPPGPERGFSRIVTHAKRTAGEFLKRSSYPDTADLGARLHAVLTECHVVGHLRNQTVHSLYRHYETIHGQPVFARTSSKTTSGGVLEQSYEELTTEAIAATVNRISSTLQDLFRLHHELMYTRQSVTHLAQRRPTTS